MARVFLLESFVRASVALSTAILLGDAGLRLAANAAPGQSNKANVTASPVKLYGQVNELLSACYNAGVEISSTKLPAVINKVRKGSPAFYSGLQDKDVITQGHLENNRLSLTIKRGTAVYGVNLATEAGSLAPDAVTEGKPGTTLSAGAQANAKTSEAAWQKLRNYDIVMLIDQSASMSDVIDGNGTTKWDWCAYQLSNFASQALVKTGRRFTIITFNGDYVLRKNCGPEEVRQTFTKNRPAGPTDLATPLDFVLNDYMKATRINPLLVVVLTDGMPARPDFIEKSIIDTTKRMSSPEQCKIVFFEIGNDADGAAVLKMLDYGLMSEGARYDIVDTNSFGRLQQVGLTLALYDTFNANFQTSLKVSPSSSLAEELAAVRKQIREAKERNAQNPSNR